MRNDLVKVGHRQKIGRLQADHQNERQQRRHADAFEAKHIEVKRLEAGHRFPRVPAVP
jgi:hypothetical protein